MYQHWRYKPAIIHFHDEVTFLYRWFGILIMANGF